MENVVASGNRHMPAGGTQVGCCVFVLLYSILFQANPPLATLSTAPQHHSTRTAIRLPNRLVYLVPMQLPTTRSMDSLSSVSMLNDMDSAT